MSEQITYTTEQIMEQAQVFASAWSLVGGRFDSGDQLEVAEQEKAELASMVTAHSAPQATDLPCEFAPEFRRALLWLLWHHQGGKSPVGQPIRAMLGIGQHDYLTYSELAEAKAYREHSLLWAVHAQGPDELWAAESREEAEHHAAALNALPGQTDTIKVNAVVIPSPWSEVEHWKTLAEQWRNEAEDRIASLQGLSTRVEKLEADHSLLASTNMAKTLDIVAIGEALGIPGEEQQGGIAEFVEAIEQLNENTALRSGVADLLHLLQYASITTPSSGDAEQAKIVMSDLTRMLAAAQPTAEQPGSLAARDVLAERHRQIEIEGWTPEHDYDEHDDDDLASAAACYATADEDDEPPAIWPWHPDWWKPRDRRRNLVKAGALILAEIERLDHSTPAKEGKDHE